MELVFLLETANAARRRYPRDRNWSSVPILLLLMLPNPTIRTQLRHLAPQPKSQPHLLRDPTKPLRPQHASTQKTTKKNKPAVRAYYHHILLHRATLLCVFKHLHTIRGQYRRLFQKRFIPATGNIPNKARTITNRHSAYVLAPK